MGEQEAFRLFEVEHFTVDEVAAMLSVSEGFAQAQLQSARRRLRRSRAAAGRPVQREGLFDLMRAWHLPSAAQLAEARLGASAKGAAGMMARWGGAALAMLMSTAMLGGLWWAITHLGQGH